MRWPPRQGRLGTRRQGWMREPKRPRRDRTFRGLVFRGGSGIRTLGPFRAGGFQDLCHRPLDQSSKVLTGGLEPPTSWLQSRRSSQLNYASLGFQYSKLMGLPGLEPGRLSAADPKSAVSTDSTTGPKASPRPQSAPGIPASQGFRPYRDSSIGSLGSG